MLSYESRVDVVVGPHVSRYDFLIKTNKKPHLTFVFLKYRLNIHTMYTECSLIINISPAIHLRQSLLFSTSLTLYLSLVCGYISQNFDSMAPVICLELKNKKKTI